MSFSNLILCGLFLLAYILLQVLWHFFPEEPIVFSFSLLAMYAVGLFVGWKIVAGVYEEHTEKLFKELTSKD